MNLLTFDPGGTTGWAYFYVDEDELAFPILMRSGEIHSPDGFNHVTWGCQVVVESFRLFEKYKDSLVGDDFPAAQKIGIIDYLNCMSKGPELIFQAPAIKKLWSNELCERIVGDYAWPQSGHARDAIRHGLHRIYLWNKEGLYKVQTP